MNSVVKLAVAVCLGMLPFSVCAEVFKCESPDGIVQFQQTECSESASVGDSWIPTLSHSYPLPEKKISSPSEVGASKFSGSSTLKPENAWGDLSLLEKCEEYSKLRNRSSSSGDYTKWDLKYDSYCP